ncbi:MAG: FtsW/RodA/SpoVE family cell cycle protein, partial [Gemmatimonadota bacterium]
LALTAIGIATCYAVGTYLTKWNHEATQQGVAALVGCAVFLAAAYLDYHLWRKLATPLFVATLAGLTLIAVIAVFYKERHAPGPLDTIFPLVQGAHRWIWVGVNVQVSEIARFTLAAWLAAYVTTLGKKIRNFNDGFAPAIGVVAIVCVLVKLEPSVTMAIVLGVIGVTVVFTAGAKVHHLALVVLAAAGLVLLILKFDAVRNNRNKTFQGSSLACESGQECESVIGLGSGGVFGVGYVKGTDKLGHLADAYSDYLLSVSGEEWVFVGVLFVTLCFIVFCWMGFRIARTAPDPFGTYLASALTMGVGVSAFLHAAVVTWLMPSTGITLPFMSVGRVSLLLNMFAAGVIVSIGRQRGRPARAR